MKMTEPNDETQKPNVNAENNSIAVGRNLTLEEWELYFPNEERRKTCKQWPLKPED
jgi:hypothetical protein